MRIALAALAVAACYSPDHRNWGNPDATTAVSLTVTIMGAGQVTVDNVGTCDSETAPHGTCTFSVPASAMQTLEAAATKEDHPFVGWTLACTGKTVSCSLLPVMSPTQVGAKFQ
jgi:hypothetical protein